MSALFLSRSLPLLNPTPHPPSTHTFTVTHRYVKEDLIIPHPITFYELILTKARGKSGPLFHFDVHDDIRLTDDHRIEKDESHPGKIVEKRWYETSGEQRIENREEPPTLACVV